MHGENGASNIKSQSHSAVLVTGATGFIGRHLIPKLVSAGKSVVVLARSRAGVGAQVRIAELFGAAPLEVLEGDLADTRQLKPALARRRLQIETVIHCAGETSFGTTTRLPSRAVQIEGPLTLLQCLAEMGLRRWSHVSTAFICGRRSGVVREHESDVGQSFHNPYEQIKLQSEIAIQLACRALRVGCVVLRPSIVIGAAPATTGGTPSNLFFSFVRTLIGAARMAGRRNEIVRVCGAPRALLNIVPVEYVASAIGELSDNAEAAGGTFHLVATNPPTQNAIAESLRARLALPGLQVLEAEEELSHPSAVEARLGKLLHPYREYLAQDVCFDDSQARALLDRRGLGAAVIDERTIDRLVGLAAVSLQHREGYAAAIRSAADWDA